MEDKPNAVMAQEAQQTATTLLAVVVQLTQELQRDHRQTQPITLDCSLERDLGLDSLARAEVILRIEQAFKLSLPEQTLTVTETPRDLLREVLRAASADHVISQDKIQLIYPGNVYLGQAESAPLEAQTLQEVLDWHVRTHPERPHIYLYSGSDQVEEITYSALRQDAEQVAIGLLAHELEPGQTVTIMLPTSRDYFAAFFGILLARAIPVPIYPPVRANQIEEHLRRHAAILNNAQARILITVSEAKPLSQLLKSQVASLNDVLTVAELSGYSGQTEAGGEQPNTGTARTLDTAFLQYTSGSTGSPKGVILSHANLLANLRAMGTAIEVDSTDVFVSWLPLYHDMGLIGAWLGSLYYSIPLVIMSPLRFLTRPQSWLWAIHNHRGTLSPAPNFAYELCLRNIKDEDIQGLDLSCWRLALNGAEPVSPDTIRRFSERFAAYGFRPETMAPVYGLAESTVGLAFPPLGRQPPIDRIQRDALMDKGLALAAAPEDPTSLQIVAVGHPLPDHQIRIVDEGGRELPERQEGSLEFRGPSCTSGYFHNADKNLKLFNEQWLKSGDRAYLAGADIYITGRTKDIIIRAGRNLYPHELEEAVSNICGIRKGCVAVFASMDVELGTERLVVLAETRETGDEVRERLRLDITDLTLDLLGTPPDDVVLAPPQTVPKTSSGKIRRAACSTLYQQGLVGKAQRAVWWQTVRLVMAGLQPRLRRTRRRLAELSYASFSWMLFTLIAPSVWLLVALSPHQDWCWAVIRGAGRLLTRLSATPLSVRGLENLPRNSPCILVANHSSYLDSIVMACTIPLQCSFVAKAELANSFIPRVFLSRLQTEFVERFDMQKGVSDARRIAKAAKGGRTLMFFPEGTFYRMPGLQCFHMGAFIAAVDAAVPVIPITIRGTRSKLRANSWFPRRGGISVTFSPPILPEGAGWAAAVKLRDEVKTEILRHCGEPDLVQTPTML